MCTNNAYPEQGNEVFCNCFSSVFEDYSDDFEFTEDGIFRRVTPHRCPNCNKRMSRNGYNTYRKKGLGSVKIGRYICGSCNESLEEDRSFWERLKEKFFKIADKLYQTLRDHNVSYRGISEVMDLIFPRGKDTIANAFQESMDEIEIPPPKTDNKDVSIVHYDEQHPKTGGRQRYRLTLLDGNTAQPIADEILDKKDPDTIEEFLVRNLNQNKEIFVVLDMYPSTPGVFKRVFGDKVIIQFCLLHLNKRIVQDFPKRSTIEQELIKYRLLGIFYNRDHEIAYLKELAKEENRMKATKEYDDWLRKQRGLFRGFVHSRKLKRRRENRKLPKRSYKEARKYFEELLDEIDSFDTPVQKRLRFIKKRWDYFTAFYSSEGAPATNNRIENYYSSSLKTHNKKKMRTEEGLKNQIKISKMRRAGIVFKSDIKIIEALSMFRLFGGIQNH